MHEEPSRSEQAALHQRITNQDLTAFAELFTVVSPHLDNYLKDNFPAQDEQDRHDIILDLLFAYSKTPTKYNPDKSSLFAYLRMAAKADMLNLLQRATRRAKHEGPSFDEPAVEDQLATRNIVIDESDEGEVLAEFRGIDLENLIALLGVNERDAALVKLIAEGGRSFEPYTEILGITDQDIAEQQRIVKRHKDRLTKWLVRHGPKRLRR